MLVKICGISNLIDAQIAAKSGTDALGFVMGGKVLPVEIEPHAQDVRKWIKMLPKYVEKYLVSHFTEVDELIDLADYVRATGIQVIETLSLDEMKNLRSKTKKKIIKTVPVEGEQSLKYLKEIEPYCDFLLLDSVVNGYIGSTGKANNWNLYAELIRQAEKPAFIAGGLNPENLFHAMHVTKAQGVDVSSGVSTYSENYLRKDRKDSEAVRLFVERAKSNSPKCSCHTKPDELCDIQFLLNR